MHTYMSCVLLIYNEIIISIKIIIAIVVVVVVIA